MTRIAFLSSLLFIGITAAQAADGKPEAPPMLLQKLCGTWKGGPCQGLLIVTADGTFERHHYSPGDNELKGTWAIRWDRLPPTLTLLCRTSDGDDWIGKTIEIELLLLDDEELVYQFREHPGEVHYTRVKK
jgi:hypothetical protein